MSCCCRPPTSTVNMAPMKAALHGLRWPREKLPGVLVPLRAELKSGCGEDVPHPAALAENTGESAV